MRLSVSIFIILILFWALKPNTMFFVGDCISRNKTNYIVAKVGNFYYTLTDGKKFYVIRKGVVNTSYGACQ